MTKRQMFDFDTLLQKNLLLHFFSKVFQVLSKVLFAQYKESEEK